MICHNDFAPYTLVFVDRRPRAIIDFDMAGPRVWDVSYAACCFIPLSGKEHSLGLPAPVDTNRRLRAFCDTYGLATEQRRALPEIIERSAATGDSGVERVIEEGHLALYRRDIELLRRCRGELQKSLE